MVKKKILLLILDGFGLSNSSFANPTLDAKYIQSLIKSTNFKGLEASGKFVGLPDGVFGNSEVGHLTIGCGRVLKQKLPLISDSIKNGKLEKNSVLRNFLKNLKSIHLLGLFSNGGVHSHLDHFFFAIDFLRKHNIKINAHLFFDGRDVGAKDGFKILKNALQSNKINESEIATVQGRFFAMDRDNRMERTLAAFNAITKGIGKIRSNNILKTIENLYNQDLNDEILPQIIMESYRGTNLNDSFWMLNFRTDRIKQILNMILKSERNFKILNMVECGSEIDQKSQTLFIQEEPKNSLAEIISQNHLRQLRIAETEKYAHVTYFMNAGQDIQYENEDRILVKSPNVNDYSKTPEMSAMKISENLLKKLDEKSYNLIIANFANPDMIGHTGNFEATKSAVKILDDLVEKIVTKATENDYITIITSDHGNAEEMLNEDGSIKKTHTTSKVPFVVIPNIEFVKNYGELSDIAPTILKLFEIEKPKEMTGESIV